MRYLLLLFALTGCYVAGAQTTTYLFIGTYTDGKLANGIYVYRMDEKTGALTQTGSGQNISNPSFLTVAPSGKYLYACTDTKTAVNGSISAFAIDSNKGSIRFMNKQSSAGANPVYLAVDKTNRFVVTANYTEGNAALLPISADGSLQPALQSFRFEGSSVNKERQEKPHVHSANFSPDYNYVYLPDLGTDLIRTYRFDTGNEQPLQAADSLLVHTLPGTGPRHMAFHPTKKIAYCIEEMGGTVSAYSCQKGKLVAIQHIDANKQKKKEYSSADIHLSPDGLFLYASNRGENSIAIFSVNDDGRLTLRGHEPTQGDVPRNFCIDPRGHFLLVANQASNNVVVFSRNQKTGLLSQTGISIPVPAPSCLQMRIYQNP